MNIKKLLIDYLNKESINDIEIILKNLLDEIGFDDPDRILK